MAQIINMPRLSDTMEEGVVAKWLINIGDQVKEGDILAHNQPSYLVHTQHACTKNFFINLNTT